MKIEKERKQKNAMESIKEIRKSTGLSQTEFANLFNIPIGTLHNWEQNLSSPPKYVIEMIKKILTLEPINQQKG